MAVLTRLGSGAGWPKAAYLASYPPRECGIATFTRDLVTAVNHLNADAPGRIVAINDPARSYAYPPAVKWQIERDDVESYEEAARLLNASSCEVVNIQHEYGLFGGSRGSHLFRFLDRIEKPVVLTMHTTLPNPESELRAVTRQIIERSALTVVLAQTARDILARDYGIDPHSVQFIPHGVPNVRFVPPDTAKRALGLEGRPVLATCGLMNPGKGIEYAIEAIAGLVDEFPNLAYLVVGETHPGVRAEMGEAYREQLEALVARLGLQRHVIFKNRYLRYRELVLHLLASDVYVVPYLDLNQIVSGTLAYALGCGRAVVSTPSAYAREVLADGRGLLADARDAQSLQTRIGAMLRNPDYRTSLQRRAYGLGHEMIWPNVARAYLTAFAKVGTQIRRRPVYVEPQPSIQELLA